MKKTKLITNYSKLSDVKIEFRAQTIINGLTDNDNFPATLPSLADFTVLKNAFSLALEKAITGERTAIAIKNNARAALISAMRQLALDIEAQANADKAKLLSSGFELAASGDNVPPLTPPKSFKISDGVNPGEVTFTSKTTPQAVSYVHEYTEDEPSLENIRWISQSSTSRTHTFRGLPSGRRIYGRIRVIGRKGQEVNSPILSRVVQ